MTDIRLVVCDMDGTLLDADGAVPDGFWPLLDDMTSRGIVFVPASGRQYQSLHRLFAHVPQALSYVAENGAVTMHEGTLLHSTTMRPDFVARVVRAVRDANAGGRRVRAILCRVPGALVEAQDPEFAVHAAQYCAELDVVDDLAADTDGVVKIAIYDLDDPAETARDVFAPFGEHHNLVVSGEHWIDITARGVDKSVGVRLLQAELGVSAEQTIAFGDYLNDLEMLGAAATSYAMDNAHPTIADAATHRAPSNVEHGVVTVLSRLLGKVHP
ncbi:hydrolase [Gordonia spumicola]|uniref:Hydrolase n=1 Tax=Gordonia spumicola TaxID=589161 RepID=A0A7I9VFG4_9ACTN|nr:Cof-type HAD-IIB family hydrolase [Gordonia spumicola]GEE03841.1 hydrolase [Gordonia spumicola]